TDGRTSGARRRKEAVMTTPESALSLLDGAIASGVKADFLLFDSWFATNQFLHSVHRKGIHSIAMAKDFNSLQFLAVQKDGTKKRMKLASLYQQVSPGFGTKDILGSVLVEVDNGKDSQEPPLPVKVVFVRNRKSGAKREWLAVLCTDTSVPDEEVVRIYGKRWSIEVFFKACKSVLRLSKEFQTRSCDSMVAHTSIVFLRYMMLSFELRPRTTVRTGNSSAGAVKSWRTSRSSRPSPFFWRY
ncbi:MAG: transposase, partial [Candidatus Methanomethylophilaceae archaeon]|nr:transposase [Candidatus Methanomethylophilaceae archaeon]